MNKALINLFTAGCILMQARPSFAQTTTLTAQQSAMLTLINNFRAQNGVGPLQVSATLQKSSEWMSTDMAARSYFSHTDSLGRDPFMRMADFGYSYEPEGENIAAGYPDAQSTFTQWQTACDPSSTGACTYAHRLNMLNASYKAVGIGYAYGAMSTYASYWTTDFGAYVDLLLNPAAAPAIASFTATPLTISAGHQVTLNWTVSGASTISIDNNVGNVTSLSSMTVMPSATTTYKLTASNVNGSSTASVKVTVGTSPIPSSISIWPNTSYPTSNVSLSGPVELGVKIRSEVAGQITGIRFYKLASSTGVHTGSLWTATGRLLATGTFARETSSGWQTLKFASPVLIAPNTTYVASYHTTSSTAAFAPDLVNSGKDNAPLQALRNGTNGPDGVYVFGKGGLFPSQGTAGYDFWVDVVFIP